MKWSGSEVTFHGRETYEDYGESNGLTWDAWEAQLLITAL